MTPADITRSLKQENHALYCQVAEILRINKQERHIRGGLATREKYLELRQEKTSAKEENCKT